MHYVEIKKHPNATKGQALVEFALIIVVLLMVIFLIIEAARIMWAWGLYKMQPEKARVTLSPGELTGQIAPLNFAKIFISM